MKFKTIFFNDIQNHIFQSNYNKIYFFYKTALYLAVENESIDIIKLLLSNDKIDVNILNILIFFFFL